MTDQAKPEAKEPSGRQGGPRDGSRQGRAPGQRDKRGKAWNTPHNPFGFTVKQRASGFAGLAISKDIALGNTMVRAQFRKRFTPTCRSIHFVLTSAQGLLADRPPVWEAHEIDAIEKRARDLNLDVALVRQGSDGVLQLVRDAIEQTITDKTAEIDAHIKATREMMSQYDLGDPSYGDKVDVYSAEITTPIAKHLLATYRQADQLALLVHALWIEEILDDEDLKTSMAVHVKRPLMRIFHTTRDLYLYLHRRWPYLVADVRGQKYPDKDPAHDASLATPPEELVKAAAEAGGEPASPPKGGKADAGDAGDAPGEASERSGTEG